MASFEGVPLTIGHVAWLDASNVNEHAVGYARHIHRDGIHLAGELVVFDEQTIARILRGDLAELSAGYSCEQGPGGVFDGEECVSSQVRVRANHVALGPRDWARCGSSCAISV